jgi:bifunctional DNA-binding transcriptional regulator/antitoxin component of YhaV-PrlF toxin-antitoxin module
MGARIANLRVSGRGQMSLPAAARRRWGIQDGGDVAAFDLGDCVVLVPGGERAARKALADAIGEGRYEAAVAAIDDLDLETQ